jgi:hypothetical protein
MNNITAKTLILIQKAKEIAKQNRIIQKKKQEDDLNRSLAYIHEHLDTWYEKYIDLMSRHNRITDPYRFNEYSIPLGYLSNLKPSKKYIYGRYCFRLTKSADFDGPYLTVKVRG